MKPLIVKNRDVITRAAEQRQEQIKVEKDARWINEQYQTEPDNGARMLGVVMILIVLVYAALAVYMIFF